MTVKCLSSQTEPEKKDSFKDSFAFKMHFDNMSIKCAFYFIIFVQWIYLMFSLSVIMKSHAGFYHCYGGCYGQLLSPCLYCVIIWVILFVSFHVTVWWCPFYKKCTFESATWL